MGRAATTTQDVQVGDEQDMSGKHTAELHAADPVLSDRDQAMLEFERQWWKYAGAKEQGIRDQFGMSATRYYQVLNGLIDTPGALEHDPLLVKRLRRLRSSRQRARSARTQTNARQQGETAKRSSRPPTPSCECELAGSRRVFPTVRAKP